MSVKTPELVLFDLDGTLVDSVPDLAYSVNATLTELALPQRELSDIRRWVGDGLEKLIHRALSNDIHGVADDDLYATACQRFMAIYSENVCRLSTAYPGIREGIEHLKQRHIKLGCVTNKRGRFVGPILEKLGILENMEIIVAGDTLEKKKPDPLPLLHAASVLDKSPEQSLMVGDSENDVKAARAAGFQIVCVSYGYHLGRHIRASRPDAVIDSIADLPNLFH